MVTLDTRFTQQLGIKYPIICGAMYPCSNPELVAAVSQSGGIGIIQPVSLVFVHGHSFRQGLRYIKTLTDKPLGVNILVEKSSKTYENRMREWVDIAIEEGVRFFVTALGNPTWVIEKVHAVNGIVYHDVTSAKWAAKAIDCGVDGLICVNNRAGGHAGTESPAALYQALQKHNLPLICAGGIGDRQGFEQALALGYDGIQMGTRFIASKECKVHPDYQDAIVKAKESDIVLTEKITGVPVSVIKTPHVARLGTKAGPLARLMLKGRNTKHLMRVLYTLKSAWQLKQSSLKGGSYKDFWQAGKSVQSIHRIESVEEIIKSMVASK